MKTDICTFVIISSSVLLRMRNVFHDNCRDEHNIHFYSVTFFFRKSCCLWNTVYKHVTARQTTNGNMTTRLTRISCWIPKATNTHSEYVILLAFRLQRWLCGHALMLRNKCAFCLVCDKMKVAQKWPLGFKWLIISKLSELRCNSVGHKVCRHFSLYRLSQNDFLRKVFGGLRCKCVEGSSTCNVCVNAPGSNRPCEVPTIQRNSPINHQTSWISLQLLSSRPPTNVRARVDIEHPVPSPATHHSL
jgi:hypothetical protein